MGLKFKILKIVSDLVIVQSNYSGFAKVIQYAATTIISNSH